MISDHNSIYRTADLMIHKYGSEAHIRAAIRAYEFIDKRDLDGQRTWLCITKAIEQLTSSEPRVSPLNGVGSALNKMRVR